MQVGIVSLCMVQLLLQIESLSSQSVFFVPGFIPLVEHMNQHALTVLMSGSQAKILQQGYLTLLNSLIPLYGHLS
jgi:hypothetical protein